MAADIIAAVDGLVTVVCLLYIISQR
jgi:hypothetical protein